MDGSGTIPGSYDSLTDLVQSVTLQAGDTVLIQGLQAIGGQAVAYSNVPGLGTQGAENFSQLVFPHGVTIRPNDATPVYLAAAGGLNPAFLLSVQGNDPDAVIETKISGVTFIGGTIGLKLDESANGSLKPCRLDSLTFCRNKVGLSAEVNGVTMDLDLDDSVVSDQVPTLVQSPALQPQTIGLKLHALENGSGAGRIEASVNSLSLNGDFATMAPEPFVHGDTGWSEYTDAGTRLIEVYAGGVQSEHRGATRYDALPIAEVVLDVNGGNWNGGAVETGVGWDVGIHSATLPNLTQPHDYSSGYRITLTGATLTTFRLAGIHGTSNESGRGEVYLLGQTTIQNTGDDAAVSPFGYVHSGVHMYTFRGYLGLVATDANLVSNAGHGIWLHNRGSILGLHEYPIGIYLRALGCKIHGNGMDGIGMSAGTETSDNGFRAAAIVGGTWDTWDGYRSLEFQGHEPGVLPRGVGSVNRCAISNNGRYGISARLKGRQEDPGDPEDAFTTAACRVANTILWNNASGAYFVSFEEEVVGGGSSTLLMPLVHCTILGNGDSSGFTAEVSDPNAGAIGFAAKYEYTSGLVAPYETVITRFFGSIFQRKSPTAADVGTQLYDLLVRDDLDPVQVANDRIGIEACRFVPRPPLLIMREHTDEDVLPWIWNPAPNWSSLVASQFFLASVGPNGELDTSVTWNTAAPAESVKDYTSYLRPSILDWRDFGAYQKNPR